MVEREKVSKAAKTANFREEVRVDFTMVQGDTGSMPVQSRKCGKAGPVGGSGAF